MTKKGFTLVEVIVSVAILSLLLILFFTYLGSFNATLSNVDILKQSFDDSKVLLGEAVYLDEDVTDGVLPENVSTVIQENVKVEKYQTTIDEVEIEYEVFSTSINTKLEDSHDIMYNFPSKKYEDKSFLIGNGVFPSNEYYVDDEPTANGNGIFYRMGSNTIPHINKSQLNYLLTNGNSVTINRYEPTSNNYANTKYIQYFSEDDVPSILNALKNRDATNPLQVVYFESPQVSAKGLDTSIASVIMDNKISTSIQENRKYEFHLDDYFTSEETHLVFITDSYFSWSRNGNNISLSTLNSDTYEFEISGGHVYFLSMSGKHTNAVETTGDIHNKFTVVQKEGQATSDMGHLTIANTSHIVGDYVGDNKDVADFSRLEIFNMTEMNNVFFYVPNQDIYIHSDDSSITTATLGGVVARRVLLGDGEKNFNFLNWEGDPRILGWDLDNDPGWIPTRSQQN